MAGQRVRNGPSDVQAYEYTPDPGERNMPRLALQGVCFGPGLVSDCVFGFVWFLFWFETGSDWFLPPRTNMSRFRNPKNNLKPNPVQNRPPVKPTLRLTTWSQGLCLIVCKRSAFGTSFTNRTEQLRVVTYRVASWRCHNSAIFGETVVDVVVSGLFMR